jgi:type IV secretion system protein VirB9
VLVQPADHSSIVASTGPSQFIPAAQLEQFKQELAALQSHVEQAVDEYKSSYPLQLKFDYSYKANEAPFDIQRHHPCRPRRPKLMVANAFSLT